MVYSDDLGQMKILNLAVVGAFAGGVAGALIGASTMFAVDALMPQTKAHEMSDQDAVVYYFSDDIKPKNGDSVLYGCTIDHENGENFSDVNCHW